MFLSYNVEDVFASLAVAEKRGKKNAKKMRMKAQSLNFPPSTHDSFFFFFVAHKKKAQQPRPNTQTLSRQTLGKTNKDPDNRPQQQQTALVHNNINGTRVKHQRRAPGV